MRGLPKNTKASVAKLVDARDLKSLGGNTVPVRLRPEAPKIQGLRFLTKSFFIACRFSRDTHVTLKINSPQNTAMLADISGKKNRPKAVFPSYSEAN